MASLVSRVVAFRDTEHFRRLWKYASVSIVSTIVSQVVLFSTYQIWMVGSAMECNVIATAVASLPAYYLNRTWTWGKTGRSKMWREVVPFWTISFTAMVISTAAVGVAAHNADRIASGSLARALIVNGANLLTYACIWTARYFIFNRYLFGTRTQVRVHDEQAELAPEIALAANGDAGALAPGRPTLAKGETVDPVADIR
ncbi:MAG: GtrA family protein [Acidimicrobiales bacterium]